MEITQSVAVVLVEDNQRLSQLIGQASERQGLAEEQMRELLRLRGEVGRLRRQNKEMETLREQNRRLVQVAPQPTSYTTFSIPTPTGSLEPHIAKVETGALHTRIIKVDLETLLANIKSTSIPANGNTNETMASLAALREFFKAHDIQFEPPATFFLKEETGELIIRTSLMDLDKIETLVMTPPDRDYTTPDNPGGP